jgi:2'-5' RNA ligase
MPFRTFIAVELAGGVRSRAEKAIQRLRAINAKVHWVKPENLHLTLKFLGDVPDSDVPKVCQVVADAVRGFDPFEIVFRGCGAFPNTAQPRTVWIGVDQGAEELTAIHQAIDAALKTELRFPRETRRFQAHLTLGRVRESGRRAAELGALIDEMADFDGDLTIVDEVVTFASFLEKSGPIHNPMGYAPLAGDATPFAYDDEEAGEADEENELEGYARRIPKRGANPGRDESSPSKNKPDSKTTPSPKIEIPDFDPRDFQKLDLSSLNLKGLHLQGTPLFHSPEDEDAPGEDSLGEDALDDDVLDDDVLDDDVLEDDVLEDDVLDIEVRDKLVDDGKPASGPAINAGKGKPSSEQPRNWKAGSKPNSSPSSKPSLKPSSKPKNESHSQSKPTSKRKHSRTDSGKNPPPPQGR